MGALPPAGHGVQANDVNYLIPVEEVEEDALLDYKALRVQHVLQRVESRGCHLNLMLLDACRSKPSTMRRGSRDIGRGLAKMEARAGSVLAFACEAGDTAADGRGRNGVFTDKLLRHLGRPGVDVDFMLGDVASEVEKGRAASKGCSETTTCRAHARAACWRRKRLLSPKPRRPPCLLSWLLGWRSWRWMRTGRGWWRTTRFPCLSPRRAVPGGAGVASIWAGQDRSQALRRRRCQARRHAAHLRCYGSGGSWCCDRGPHGARAGGGCPARRCQCG